MDADSSKVERLIRWGGRELRENAPASDDL